MKAHFLAALGVAMTTTVLAADSQFPYPDG